MKPFLLILSGLFFCHAAFAQADSTACLNYNKGYFSYTDSLGNTVLVHRRKKYQYEKNTVTKVRTQFRLSWMGNCSYQITQAITNSKAARKYKYSSTKVVIDKTDGDNGYTYSCGCNDGSKFKSGYMKKLSKERYYALF
ncbi:MAG: hypothetical protein WAT20_08345 [Ferruginibacter sp.]|nr:hypothetical protein [Chitinophagaceae bacterium]